MGFPKGADQYKKTSVFTASPGKILIMLYEAAIQHVKKAILAIEEHNLEKKGKHIIKAHEILNEFVNTLDLEKGGDIAKDLHRLYDFMISQLIEANIKNKKENLLGIQKNLETLLEGWRGALKEVQKNE